MSTATPVSTRTRIAHVTVFSVELPVADGGFHWSKGRSAAAFDSTLVRLETEDGLVGWGETCPLGAAYVPAYAEGVRAGIARLAPAVVGADPCEPATLAARLDAELCGHPYAKAAIDI